MVPDRQGQLHAGAQAAIAGLASLRWAWKTGRGQYIDVSVMESMLTAHCWTSVAWTHGGTVLRREVPDALPCADGWAVLMYQRWDPTLFTLIERPELADDPRFASRQGWADHQDAIKEIVGEWTSTTEASTCRWPTVRLASFLTLACLGSSARRLPWSGLHRLALPNTMRWCTGACCACQKLSLGPFTMLALSRMPPPRILPPPVVHKDG